MRIFALHFYDWKTDKNSPLLVSATSKLSSHIQSCISITIQEWNKVQSILCLDEPDTILFNSFKLCLVCVAPDGTSTFLTV